MAAYVALLRGINVGKAKRVAMADLRAVFEELGMTSVKTVLQSGNVVFSSDAAPDPAAIESAVLARCGVQSTVLVLSGAQIRAVAQADPMIGVADNPSRHVVTFTDRTLPNFELPDSETLAPELIAQGPRAFYQWLPFGVLETKVPTAFWKQVGAAGVATTARNRRTVDKLLGMLDELPG